MASKKVVKRKKKKGEHSCPETAGKQNLPKQYIDKKKGSGGGLMKDLVEMRHKGMANRQDYAGKWTDEALEKEVDEFFDFCAEKDIKPAKAGLRMWLGLSESQYWEWSTNTSSHPLKSKILAEAAEFMQMQYIGQGEKYPTFNMFLLKAGHNYSDKQEIEVTNKDVSQEDINDIVSKMGLDK